jgi:hypothetical protein
MYILTNFCTNSSPPSHSNAHSLGTHAQPSRSDSRSLHHRLELRASEFADFRRPSLVFRCTAAFHLDRSYFEAGIETVLGIAGTLEGILVALDRVENCWQHLRDGFGVIRSLPRIFDLRGGVSCASCKWIIH